MSRRIKCTPHDIQQVMQHVNDILISGKFQDGQLTFTHRFQELDDVARLTFSSKAWTKMISLVLSFDKEVQWHGVVERISTNSFRINDILVFPHEITSATVTSDQTKYEEWLNELDDETFNHLRFHGHSHVNMAVSPSGVDMQYRENMLQNINANDDEAYYIFMIINKQNKISAEIYDIENNMLYGTADIEFVAEIDDGKEYINNFIDNAKTLATERVLVSNKQSKKEKKKENYSHYNYPIGFNDDPCDGCETFDCENCKRY